MGAPHHPDRYGETWPPERIDAGLAALLPLKEFVIISGGWAWHFMSPRGHVELKHAHDHEDLDVFIPPAHVGTVISILKEMGFRRVSTKYDRLPSREDFRRYEKTARLHDGNVRLVLDSFVRKDVPFREMDGWKIVDPVYLLTLYSDIHSSDKCFAVRAAKKLIERGLDPVRRKELTEIPP